MPAVKVSRFSLSGFVPTIKIGTTLFGGKEKALFLFAFNARQVLGCSSELSGFAVANSQENKMCFLCFFCCCCVCGVLWLRSQGHLLKLHILEGLQMCRSGCVAMRGNLQPALGSVKTQTQPSLLLCRPRGTEILPQKTRKVVWSWEEERNRHP